MNTNRNVLFLLLLLLNTCHIYKTQYKCCGNKNCTDIKECSVPNCFVAININKNLTYGKHIDISIQSYLHFDCWMWNHEINFCPNKSNSCNYAHGTTESMTFCCHGNLCNNPTNLICTKNDKREITTKRTYVTTTNQNSNNSSSFNIIYILIIITVIIILIIIIIIMIKVPACNSYIRRIRKLFIRQQSLQNRSNNCNLNGIYYTRDFTINNDFNDAYSNNVQATMNCEIDQVSQYYQKDIKKSVGKFGEIWLGKLTTNCINPNNGRGRNNPQSIPIDLPTNVAIKIFKPNNEPSWEVELEMYRHIRNRCSRMLHFVGWDKILDQGQISELWLLTSYMERGSLHDCLKDTVNNPRPNWTRVLNICIDIAGGLSFLHEDGSYQYNTEVAGKPSIAHRDLKSRNVLISQDWHACIGDLGLAVSFQGSRSVSDLHIQVGTHRYMAPEVLEGAISFTRDAFLAIDVYAMSLVMWEIFSQCDNFQGLSPINNIIVEPYMQPFEKELGNQIKIESLQEWIIAGNNRPAFPSQFQGFELGLSMWKTIIECWDKEAEGRLSSSCVYERLQDLLSRTSSLINQSEQTTNQIQTEPLLTNETTTS